MTDDPDLEEFVGGPGPGPRGCVIGKAIQDLDEDDARKLRKALASPEARHSRIESWLRKRGVRAYVGAVARHRQGGCSCEENGLV